MMRRETFSFHVEKDKDILEQLRRQTNKSAYVRMLIRRDLQPMPQMQIPMGGGVLDSEDVGQIAEILQMA